MCRTQILVDEVVQELLERLSKYATVSSVQFPMNPYPLMRRCGSQSRSRKGSALLQYMLLELVLHSLCSSIILLYTTMRHLS